MPKRAKLLHLFLAAETVIALLVWQANFTLAEAQHLRVHFFDIGQGDAIFLELPDGNQILVDGGPSSDILSKLSKVMPFWDRSLDMVVLTHPHADHLDGLLEVLKRYEVGEILESGVAYSTADYEEWKKLVKEKQIRDIVAKQGQVFQAGDDFTLEVLAPIKDFQVRSVKNVHEADIVLKVIYGRESILLTGDMEKPLEYELVFQPLPLFAQILKVGHHGSKTSSSDGFLEAVKPELAIISAGRKNRYGHPHQEVLDRLQAHGIRVARTDVDGDIEVDITQGHYGVFFPSKEIQ